MPWKIILQTCHASLGLMAVSATAAVQMIDHFLCPNAMMIGALANLESLLQADDSMTVSEIDNSVAAENVSFSSRPAQYKMSEVLFNASFVFTVVLCCKVMF